MRRPTLLLTLPVALSGCIVAGPNYHLPKASVAASPGAAQPFSASKGGSFSEKPLPGKWWQLYNDPRLDTLVTEALAANTDLRAADANLRRSNAITQRSLAARTLSTTISGDGNLSRPSGTGYSLPGILGYAATIGASIPLDFSGRITRVIEASRADADVDRATRDQVRVAVAAAVTRAYASVCAANFSLATNQRIVALQRGTRDATQRLQRGGRGTAFDVTRAEAAVQQSEASLPAFEAQRETALFRIAALLGRVPADYPRDIAVCATIPALASAMPVSDGAALIARRPDIRGAERRLAADTARLGVATADLYPQVSFGASLGLAGPLKSIGSGNSLGFSFGPLLSWSFPNRPVVKADIAAAGATVDADLANFDSAMLGALREVETALTVYVRDRERLAALGRARDTAAKATDQANRLFRFGRTDFLQLLDAQRSLAAAEATVAAAQTGLINDQIDIFLALGGGWQTEPGG
jgi:multidrug efflux system outer membrane protein